MTGLAVAATATTLGGIIVVGTAFADQNMTTTAWVNFRSGPSTDYSILTVVPSGATVKASGARTGAWVQVTYNGQQGFIHDSFLKSSTPQSDAPSTSGAKGKVTTNAEVNVRTGPGLGNSIVTLLNPGVTLETTGTKSGDWTQVIYQGTQRWMFSAYLTPEGTQNAAPAVPATVGKVRTTDALNMRTEGNINGSLVGVLPANSIVDVTGKTTSDYTQILYQGRALWIWSKYVGSVNSSPTPLLSASGKASQLTAQQQVLVNFVRSKVGGPYVWGGEGPRGFDCSGIITVAYRQLGISIPHYSVSQSKLGRPVSKSEMQPGDIILWYKDISHVSIYVGNGQMVHARNYRVGIVEQSVDSYIQQGAPFMGARRILS